MRFVSVWAALTFALCSMSAMPEMAWSKTKKPVASKSKKSESKKSGAVKPSTSNSKKHANKTTKMTAVAKTATPAFMKFDVEAATKAYINKMDKKKRARADTYYEGGYWLQLFDYLIIVVISLLLLFTKLSAKMRNLAVRISKYKPVQTLLYWIQFMLVMTLCTFPMLMYKGYFREHAYGFSTQTMGAWLAEQLIGSLITLILGGILFVLLYWVVQKARNTWWIWGSVVTVFCMAIILFISPVFIEPLFNKYEKLTDPKVRDPILRLAAANGLETDDVFVVDSSKQHNRISANVSGLFGTQRIALNDNLIKQCSLPEIESVMGHEIGHYVLNHIPKSFLFLFVVIVTGFGLLYWAAGRILTRFGERFGGISGPGDTAGLPLLTLLISTYFLLMTPVVNSWSRMHEKEADLFALNAARVPDAQAAVELKVGEYRKTDPGMIEEIIFFHHPSTISRVRMAMQWKSASLGK